MTRYSVQPKPQIFVKGYGFLSVDKYMGRNMGKNISKNLSSKYSQKLIDHVKEPATDALKTASKRAIRKTEEATGDLIGKKIADRIIKVSKASAKINSEEKLRERFISPELRRKSLMI